MDGIAIAPVTHKDVPLLEEALQHLAADLGDVYSADQPALAQAVCGPQAGCFALLATRDGRPMGAALSSPVFSTMRGGAGMFVSDLWVAESARGKGLARRLLAATLREGARRNAGRFLKLTVYQDNPKARAVYDRLGFAAQAGETNMILTGAPLETLRDIP